MSDPETGGLTALSGYIRQMGRALVYLLILQYSIGIAVRMVVKRAVSPTPPTLGVLSTLVVAVVAGVLVNSSYSPSYRQLTVFTFVSLVVVIAASAVVGVGDGYIGALYPTVQTILIWLGAFLIAYPVAFWLDWSQPSTQ
ncbi:hypothetical protein [Halorussus sp. MSC15.2]|uniref:hypothetical protein n=1 Tax=Halorussus sp. MSC15.2 TaxID=2283638 RepID=UPI0013D70997|nr:hypothetical protein [Halorussus sp. MSC15.2]NEU59155.1 hypothetical protein [Halorussus sp. MSC15.2]